MGSVLYHNDGKEKGQSHHIYSNDLESHLDVDLQGFGSTKEEAYLEFVSRLDEYINKVQQFRNEISIEKTVVVDCFGKEL
ncbi:hypothetical protein ACI3ER_12080 [Bacillus sp. Wb]